MMKCMYFHLEIVRSLSTYIRCIWGLMSYGKHQVDYVRGFARNRQVYKVVLFIYAA